MAPLTTIDSRKIAGLAEQAGFSRTKSARGGTELEVAVAVALAESGGLIIAINQKPPDRSYGLWQINMRYDDDEINRRKQLFGISEETELFWPQINARAAYALFREQTFRAWTVYKTNAYFAYLPKAKTGARDPIPWTAEDNNIAEEAIKEIIDDMEGLPDIPKPPFIGDPIENLTGLVDGLVDAVNGLVNVVKFVTNPENWLRVAGFVGGGILLLFGFILAARETGIGEKAANAIPMAKLVRKVAK